MVDQSVGNLSLFYSGEIFKQSLELALQLPQSYQESKSFRVRFISFVHRMVETLGTVTLPYLPTALQVCYGNVAPHYPIASSICKTLL